jgi:hypothetical protein
MSIDELPEFKELKTINPKLALDYHARFIELYTSKLHHGSALDAAEKGIGLNLYAPREQAVAQRYFRRMLWYHSQ